MEEGDLTTEEKLALMGLLKGYKTMHGKGEVRRRAIKNYDLWENRIVTYNRAVVRTLARRRICKWAKHGSESGGQVDNDDMLGSGVIQE
ncbi:hypothetical protein CEP51_015944 [Fusarium floridanum]|uniref:Uncharacterized protein n=1 Tax=Fusarium floridanum TaxID=1325733 RepID=A0A428P024_9HYPO|nr:hypothetical protein CEP51_015944 [Fusarium floridanum]